MVDPADNVERVGGCTRGCKPGDPYRCKEPTEDQNGRPVILGCPCPCHNLKSWEKNEHNNQSPN